jgi:hypothetical protein
MNQAFTENMQEVIILHSILNNYVKKLWDKR